PAPQGRAGQPCVMLPGRSHNNSHASTPVLPGTYHKRRPHCPFAALYLPAHTRPRQRAMTLVRKRRRP
ncbi:MAG TPA: hypothetical protein VGE05_13225, partial [Novosphingobium sp.]